MSVVKLTEAQRRVLRAVRDGLVYDGPKAVGPLGAHMVSFGICEERGLVSIDYDAKPIGGAVKRWPAVLTNAGREALVAAAPEGQEDQMARLKWQRDRSTPADVFVSTDGEWELIYDPAGRSEAEDGGWYLWRGREWCGIFPKIGEAKRKAEGSVS